MLKEKKGGKMGKELEVTESTALQFVLVRDKTGKEFVCKLSDLKDPSTLSEKEKENCIENVKEYWNSA